MKRSSRLAMTAALACLPLSALAEGLPDMVQGEMLQGWRNADGSHVAALRLVLAPGWKTYWRAPGDAGIPPQFAWQGSTNLESVAISWPVPDVFFQNGRRSVGYHDVVVIPITFFPAETDAEIGASALVEIGVCEEICVPKSLRITATLPPDAASRDPAITAALADRPMLPGEAGVTAVSCVLDPIADGMRLTATIDMPPLGRGEATVVELENAQVWVSEPTVTRNGASLRTTADLVPPEAAPFVLERSALRFTVIADGRAVDIRGCG